MNLDLTLIPKKKEGIRWVIRANKIILALNPYTDQLLEMNEVGSLIWLLIDGRVSLNFIIDKIYNLTNMNSIPKAKIREDVTKFFKKLLDAKMIEF